MRMLRRRFLVLAAAVTCAATIGATVVPATAQDQAPATINVMGFQVPANEAGTPLDQAYQQFLDDFRAANPTITVNSLETPPEADTQTLVDLSAGAGPDVWQQDASSLAKYVDAGVVLDMRQCMEAVPSLTLDRFFPNVLAINERDDGAIYGLPNDFTPMVLYLSNKAFENAGVDKPAAGWTWDDLLSLAQQTTLDSSGRNVLDPEFDAENVAQWGYRVRQYPYAWIYRLWQNGTDVLSPDATTASGYLDSPEAIDAIQQYADLMLVHHVAPPLNQLDSMTTAVGFPDRFLKGEFAMFDSGHWELVGLQASPEWSEDAIDVVAQPKGSASDDTVIYQATFAINAAVANDPAKLAAACSLVDAATGPGYQDTKVLTGIAISGTSEAAEKAVGESVLPDVEEKFQAAVSTGRPPWGSRLAAYPAVETILESMMERILNGSTVADEVASAVEEINRELGA
jgi:multiple sugar transport system substrate-binding protein